MPVPELDRLAIFQAVAAAESFSGAATRLGMPKSTVSRAVSALEGELDLRLFHRTTRQVTLTTAGAALLERVAPALDALTAALHDLPERDDAPAGEVRITAPVDFGATVLADIIAAFTLRHPAVRIDLHLTNSVLDLVKGGFDLAFRFAESLGDSALVARKISVATMHMFAAPSYLARRGTPRSPADLAEHDWIVFRAMPTLDLDGPGGHEKVTATGPIVCDDMMFARAAARAGAGIACLPAFITQDAVRAGELASVLPRWCVRSGNMWVVTPGGRNPPRKVAAFRDFALENLRTRPLALASSPEPES